jgi:hypothetical protein
VNGLRVRAEQAARFGQRRPPPRGLGFATATTSATFFPQRERRFW